jgi:DNA polymerase-3 subunit gamma/tau
MALYRTYRPATLAEVVGQDHVTVPLRRALETNRVHHAYLFSGPRGCGKTSTARILARSLNCELGPTPDPCGTCQSCVDLAADGSGSIDVIELDAASHGRVEDTRDLRERAMFAPASSRYKIYIIDEAHMVTPQGFNALLKLVEEPPPHVRFIFATTEADKVLPTIRSRTHNYTFRLVPVKTLQQHLIGICAAEAVPAEPTALALVARAGAGSVRDSLSILGQVISGSGPEGVTYADAVGQLGMTDAALLDQTADALAAMDGPALFLVIDQVMEAGHEPRRFVTDLLERLRDLIVISNVPGAVEAGLVDGPDDQVAREVEQARRFGAAELARAADVVSAALSELKGATAPRLQLELMAARLLLPAVDADERGMRARMDQLERRLEAGAPAAGSTIQGRQPAAVEPVDAAAPRKATRKLSEVAPSSGAPLEPVARPQAQAMPESAPSEPEVRSDPPTPSADAPAAARGSNGPSIQEVRSMWPAVLDATKAYGKVAWIVFNASVPLSLDNGVLAVGLAKPGEVNSARNSGHDERLRQAILDVLRIDVRVDVVLAPDAMAPTAAQPAPTRTPEVDAPSPDDADLPESSGVDVVIRSLGATQIGEIDH